MDRRYKAISWLAWFLFTHIKLGSLENNIMLPLKMIIETFFHRRVVEFFVRI